MDNKRPGRPELLVPASSLEVLRTAVLFGADAVYIGGESFGLRAKAKNFSLDEMREGVTFAHARGVRVYVTANILAHNDDLAGVRAYFEELRDVWAARKGQKIFGAGYCGGDPVFARARCESVRDGKYPCAQ